MTCADDASLTAPAIDDISATRRETITITTANTISRGRRITPSCDIKAAANAMITAVIFCIVPIPDLDIAISDECSV